MSMVYSFSRLNIFTQCKYAWYLKYVLKIKEPVTVPLELGKAVHEAIALLLTGQCKSVEEACVMAIQKAELPLDFAEVKMLVNRDEVIQLIGKVSPDQVESHFQRQLDSEDMFAPEVQGYKDLRIPGGIPQVWDWKTNRIIYEPEDNNQLGLYAWDEAMATGAEEVVGKLIFLREPPESRTRMTLYTREDMEKARKWAQDTAEEIESCTMALAIEEDPDKLFPATPGSRCRYCGYAAQCVAKSEELAQYLSGDKDAVEEQSPAPLEGNIVTLPVRDVPQVEIAPVSDFSTPPELPGEPSNIAETVTLPKTIELVPIRGGEATVVQLEAIMDFTPQVKAEAEDSPSEEPKEKTNTKKSGGKKQSTPAVDETGIKKPATEAEAEEMLRQLMRLEKAASDYKIILKEWVKENGPVQADDRVYKECVSICYTLPDAEAKKQLFTLALDKGHNPWDELSIPKTFYDKVGITEDEVKALGGKPKKTSSYRICKADEVGGEA